MIRLIWDEIIGRTSEVAYAAKYLMYKIFSVTLSVYQPLTKESILEHWFTGVSTQIWARISTGELYFHTGKQAIATCAPFITLSLQFSICVTVLDFEINLIAKFLIPLSSLSLNFGNIEDHLWGWFYRNNRQEVFCENFILKSFVKFTGKHLSWILFCSLI